MYDTCIHSNPTNDIPIMMAIAHIVDFLIFFCYVSVGKVSKKSSLGNADYQYFRFRVILTVGIDCIHYL